MGSFLGISGSIQQKGVNLFISHRVSQRCGELRCRWQFLWGARAGASVSIPGYRLPQAWRNPTRGSWAPKPQWEGIASWMSSGVTVIRVRHQLAFEELYWEIFIVEGFSSTGFQ